MSVESQSLFFFLLICVGFLVPVGGLYYLIDFNRRRQRLPLFASFENLSERFEAKKKEYEDLKEQLADFSEKVTLRDMAKTEAEVWLRKTQQAEEDLHRLEPSLREFERVQVDLRREQEILQRITEETSIAKSQLDDILSQLGQRRHEEDQTNRKLLETKEELNATSTNLEGLREQLKELEASKHSMELDVRGMEDERQLLQQSLDWSKSLLADLHAESNSIITNIQDLKGELGSLGVTKSSLEEQIRITGEHKQELERQLEVMRTQLSDVSHETAVGKEYYNELRARNAKMVSDLGSLQQEKQGISDAIKALTLDLSALEVGKAAAQEQLQIASTRQVRLEREIAEAKVTLERLAGEIATKARDLENLQGQHKILGERIENDTARLSKINLEFETTQREMDSLKAEITSLNALKKVIEGSFEQSAAEEEDEAVALGNLLDVPSCLRGLEHENEQWAEMEALDALSDHLRQLGLQFSKRVLYAFHTNLKISDVCPLVVLAGISGTGKSELPRRYAEALGIHFLQVAVQPRWDSPQDLFGFYNYLERNYRATELAQAMVCMDQWNWEEQAANYKHRLLMVLLDEMNLARVEYYFSEFLSRLETRKSVDPNDEFSRRPVEISLELGGKASSGPQRRVFPSKNILFVGTMNEDESTQSISEKVIDRAPVIRFARPETLSSVPPHPTQTPTDSFLSDKLWKAWHRDYRTLAPPIISDIEGWISTLNKALDGLGRPFGHRLNQAIMAYVANHPEMVDRGHSSAAKKAFADQLEQRIFPKLRGLEMDDDRITQNANDILKLVSEDLEDEELANAFKEAKDRILFTWMGVKRSEE